MSRVDVSSMTHGALEDDPNESSTYRMKVRDAGAGSEVTNSNRVEEINPLSQQYLEQELVDTTNIASAATGNYYPSSTGLSLGGAMRIAVQHGLSNDDYPSTLTYEASLDDAASPDFVDITKTGLELNAYTRSNASFTVTSAAASNIVLFDVAPFKAFRAKIVHSGATNAHQLHFKTLVL